MNNEIYSVTCPYCNRRQIVERNSEESIKEEPAPIFYPLPPNLDTNNVNGTVSSVSSNPAFSLAKDHMQKAQGNIPTSNTFSFPSMSSAFNILASIKIGYNWFKKKERLGRKNQNKHDPWLTVTCSECRSAYLYNPQTKCIISILGGEKNL